jgi:hypothetical protein
MFQGLLRCGFGAIHVTGRLSNVVFDLIELIGGTISIEEVKAALSCPDEYHRWSV